MSQSNDMNERTAALHNLGCKVNAYETEAMQQQLEKAGYKIVPFAPGADVYIINTCSVTNVADRKSRQMMHKARKMNEDAVIVAAGCYVQTAVDETGHDIDADIIVGNNKKKDLVGILDHFFEEKEKLGDTDHKILLPDNAEDSEPEEEKTEATMEVIDINHTGEYENLKIDRTEEHTRAYIKVQDGCNQFCSYCIIPYARGRVRSRESSDVIEEVKALTDSGIQEIVLTGIHLTSYGTDFEKKDSLLHLIEEAAAVPGVKRIRLGSLEPGVVTEDFVRTLSQMDVFCPHFHLSLQSGCDSVLKRMNRKYTTAEFEKGVDLLRTWFDDPALTTDIIVGFPQETEEEFAETVEYLKRIQFYETHVFKYSRRAGTRADAMSGQIAEAVKAARSDVLLDLNKINKAAYEERHIGKNAQVLFEEAFTSNGITYYSGYTKEYIRTAIPADRDYTNMVLEGKLRKLPLLTGAMLFEPMQG